MPSKLVPIKQNLILLTTWMLFTLCQIVGKGWASEFQLRHLSPVFAQLNIYFQGHAMGAGKRAIADIDAYLKGKS